MDKMTIMGTDYARLSLKTQSLLRSVVANLPTDIQFRILESKAMFGSLDLWFKYFEKLVTATILDPMNWMKLIISLSNQIGKNTLGVVSERMKRNIHFLVF